GLQHAERFGEKARAVLVEMRRFDVDDDIERRVRQLEPLGDADAELDAAAGAAPAREFEVLLAQVDAYVTARLERAVHEARAAAAAAAHLDHVAPHERCVAHGMLVEPQAIELRLVLFDDAIL